MIIRVNYSRIFGTAGAKWTGNIYPGDTVNLLFILGELRRNNDWLSIYDRSCIQQIEHVYIMKQCIDLLKKYQY